MKEMPKVMYDPQVPINCLDFAMNSVVYEVGKPEPIYQQIIKLSWFDHEGGKNKTWVLFKILMFITMCNTEW